MPEPPGWSWLWSSEAADGCFVYGERVVKGVCGEVFTLPSGPRLVAEMPATRDILTSALTPPRRDAYDGGS